jgi:hypothetical protein
VTDGQKKTSDVSEIIPESSSCSDDIHISPSEEIQEIRCVKELLF